MESIAIFFGLCILGGLTAVILAFAWWTIRQLFSGKF